MDQVDMDKDLSATALGSFAYGSAIEEAPYWFIGLEPMMLLMTTFLGGPADNDSRRTYQRDSWGSLNPDTCVIGRSGLAAPT
jgi:hypothetical protein